MRGFTEGQQPAVVGRSFRYPAGVSGQTTAVTVRASQIRRVLLFAVAILAAIGFAVEWIEYRALELDPGILVPTFSLSYEGNVPTWFAASLLLCCSLLLAVVAHTSRARVRHWWGLCLGFAYISMDEAVGVHEAASSWFDTDGWLYYGWVIPGTAVVLALAGIYGRFVWELPSEVKTQVIWAGALYVGGALAMELPLGYWAAEYGSDNLGYALIDLVEESLELVGVSLFIAALLDYLSIQNVQIQVGFARPRA